MLSVARPDRELKWQVVNGADEHSGDPRSEIKARRRGEIGEEGITTETFNCILIRLCAEIFSQDVA